MPQRFQISQDSAANILLFTLPPMLDSLEIDGLIDSVLAQIDLRRDQGWVVDLSQVEYLGSSMLGLFVNMRERIRQGGGMLVLCGMSQQLLRIFKTCCLERLFTIVKTRGDAISHLSRR
jgi:anti-anti-sigma factor